MVDEIIKYFPDLSDLQIEKISGLKKLYMEWNRKINVISRKDMDNFNIHHLLHSMAIAKVFSFVPGSSILDAGTGGGFPGIPLSILFPDSEFTLLDSIEKKMKVVNAVSKELTLNNVRTVRSRIEEHKGKYDFIVCRAVTTFPEFVRMTSKNIHNTNKNNIKNGIIYLKGGNLTDELSQYRHNIKVWDIKDFFTESFFETKRIVYLPI